MLFPSSGRLGFDPLKFPEEAVGALPEITVDCVAAMLRRENELRLSDPVQKAMEVSGPENYGGLIDAVQLQVATEFGLGKDGVDIMRAAMSLWGNDPSISGKLAQIPMYIRHNRAEQGALGEGGSYPDCRLHSLNGGDISLKQLDVD